MDTSSVATNEEDGARKQIERQSYWHSLKKGNQSNQISTQAISNGFQGNYQWLIGCILPLLQIIFVEKQNDHW